MEDFCLQNAFFRTRSTHFTAIQDKSLVFFENIFRATVPQPIHTSLFPQCTGHTFNYWPHQVIQQGAFTSIDQHFHFHAGFDLQPDAL